MWKNELIEILFSNNPSKINAKKAINLKYKNIPSSLYRYRSFNEHSLELLKTDKIKLSRPTDFNDPFDCALKLFVKDMPKECIIDTLLKPNFIQFKEDFNLNNKELCKVERKKDPIHYLVKCIVKKNELNLTFKERAKRIEEFEENIKSNNVDIGHKKHIHVACFSEINDSILMWSHYANDHKGFCVEYDFKELGLNNPFARFIFPVYYSDNIFDLSDYLKNYNRDDIEFEDVLKQYLGSINLDDIQEGIELPKRAKKFNNMVVFCNALRKFNKWADEKEWRYVFPYKNISNKSLYLPVPKPGAIYLGAKISEENSEKVLKIAKERSINVYKMKIKHSEYALESKIIYKSKNNFS